MVELRGVISNNSSLTGKINETSGVIKGSIFRSATDPSYDEYEGSYEVTPSVDPQQLETENKVMKENVNIKSIPFYKVSNIHHGNTVIIGGTINE